MVTYLWQRILGAACCVVLSAQLCATPRIILDTDLGTRAGDIDDLGAVALLHNMANRNDCLIDGIVLCHNGNPEALLALDAINHFYNRGHIGIAKKDGSFHSDHTSFVDRIAEQFPHEVDLSAVPDATVFYRAKLVASKPNSVTIVTIGQLVNIVALMQSPPDSISPLTGAELIAEKVDQLVVMGGIYPSSGMKAEPNLKHSGEQGAQFVVNQFPRPILFSGAEIGRGPYKTGASIENLPESHLLRVGYRAWFQAPPKWGPPASDTILDWNTYDQCALYVAVHGAEPWFEVVRGINQVKADGSNHWLPNETGSHYYIRSTRDPKQFAEDVILPLMLGEEAVVQ